MIKFPPHKCELTLSHNMHKNYYAPVEQAIKNNDHGYREDRWVNEKQKVKAIEINDSWTLQWYPNTPISFRILSAADLDVLLEYANKD